MIEGSEAPTAAPAHRMREGQVRPGWEEDLSHLGRAAPANDNARPPEPKSPGGDG